MKNTKYVVMSTLAGVILFGCHAEDRVAQKDPVVAPPVQKFIMGAETQGDSNIQSLQNNKAFFWRDGMPKEIATLVNQAGDDVDRNDDAGISARAVMSQLQARVDAARADFYAATDKLDATVKQAVTDLYDGESMGMIDEKDSMPTPDEFTNDIMPKTERDLVSSNAKLTAAAAGQAADVRDALVQLGSLGAARARLDQADPARDELAKKIDAFTKALPKLPPNVVAAQSDRDALITTLEGNYRDRARAKALPGLIADRAKALAGLTADMTAKKEALDALYGQKDSQNQVQYAIARKGEALVNTIINNTDFFDSMPERVTFHFHGSAVDVSITNFPWKGSNLSTEDGSIRNVTYNSQGGLLHFEAYPEAGDGPYYLFKLGRTRLGLTDGRVFYTGEMNLCKLGGDCNPKHGSLLRHGIAKFATSN